MQYFVNKQWHQVSYQLIDVQFDISLQYQDVSKNLNL